MLTGNSVYKDGQFENPGPAPRPPLAAPPDAPRLGLMPATAGIPGNASRQNLNSLQHRSATPLNGGDFSSPALSRSTTLNTLNSNPDGYNYNNGVGGVAVVKEGPARVKDGMLWKKRHLILRAFALDVHKDKDGKVIFKIALKDVINVSRSENVRLAFEIIRLAKPDANIAREPIGSNRDLPQKTTLIQVESDDDIYNWMDAIIGRCPGMGGVSGPTDFKHRVHVGFDEVHGNFTGLPKEWEKLLSSSTLTREDYRKDPKVLLEVVDFYHNLQQRGTGKPQTPPHSISSTSDTSSQQRRDDYNNSLTNLLPPPPPRPPPPSSYGQSRPSEGSSPTSRTVTPTSSQRNVSGNNRSPEQSNKLNMDQSMRQAMEEEARRVRETQEQRQRDRRRVEEEVNRKDQESYESTIPKTRVPRAQQEIGGGFSGPADDRSYSPMRTAPPAPGVERNRQQPPGSLRAPPSAQRQAPHAPQAPHQQNGLAQQPPRPPYAQKQPPSRDQSPTADGSLRTPSKPEHSRYAPPARPPPSREGERKDPHGVNGYGPGPTHKLPVRPQQPQHAPNAPTQQPAPLKVKQPAVPSKDDHHQAPENAQPAKSAAARQREVRMSNMTEAQVMEKLKQVVSKDDPSVSYTKQKKIGQGASGSVYVARINESATSSIARRLFREHGPRSQVAIKQMDLRNQPRKELIVNEIIVMKESMHPNIVNFLDSFLQEANNELWVVMEFMEGGALTDVIDNNPNITEAQMATVCREVRNFPSSMRHRLV